MKIFLTPQHSEKTNFKYIFQGDLLIIENNGITDEFDFTGLPDGTLEDGIETILGTNPIVNAEKKDGVLYLELLNRIGTNASEEEKFPEWIDADSYVFKEVDNGEVELEKSEGN